MERILSVFEIRDGKEAVGDAFRVLSVVAFIVLVAFLTYLASTNMECNKWKSECVKRGFAEYNSATGNWQWKP